MEREKNKVYVVQASQFQFKGTDEEEPIVCAWNGCNKHLSLTEKLCGNMCLQHQNRKKFNPCIFLKYD